MVRILKKSDPVSDTYSIFQFHVKEVIWVRIPAAAPSFVVLASKRHISLGFETEASVEQEGVQFPAIHAGW